MMRRRPHIAPITQIEILRNVVTLDATLPSSCLHRIYEVHIDCNLIELQGYLNLIQETDFSDELRVTIYTDMTSPHDPRSLDTIQLAEARIPQGQSPPNYDHTAIQNLVLEIHDDSQWLPSIEEKLLLPKLQTLEVFFDYHHEASVLGTVILSSNLSRISAPSLKTIILRYRKSTWASNNHLTVLCACLPRWPLIRKVCVVEGRNGKPRPKRIEAWGGLISICANRNIELSKTG